MVFTCIILRSSFARRTLALGPFGEFCAFAILVLHKDRRSAVAVSIDDLSIAIPECIMIFVFIIVEGFYKVIDLLKVNDLALCQITYRTIGMFFAMLFYHDRHSVLYLKLRQKTEDSNLILLRGMFRNDKFRSLQMMRATKRR
jgi:hypothetical protein